MIAFKVLVLIFSTLSGFIFFDSVLKQINPVFGAIAGAALGLLAVIIRDQIVRIPLKHFIGGFLGFLVAVSPLYVFTAYLDNPRWDVQFLGVTLGVRFILGMLFGYIGISVGVEKIRNINIPMLDERTVYAVKIPKVLDTSVLIDGRISEIIESGFLEGPIVVPQFIIKELQTLSDSLDAIKRGKGRRGLDIIRQIQKGNVEMEISDTDFFRIKEVDLKLVNLAKKVKGRLVTIDYNLSKVAELQGVQNLNLNILANALKPSLVAGEVMQVFVLKEGKESGQGVAYLEDGTMVVVEDGKKFIGQKAEVEVKSVLQTPSGRIIFTHIYS